MRIQMIQCAYFSDEIAQCIYIIKHRLSYFISKHQEYDNIFAVVLLENAVVSELYFRRRGKIETRHEDDVEDFEDWMDMRIRGVEVDAHFVSRYNKGENNLYLTYQFDQAAGARSTILMESTDDLVEQGKKVEKLIVRLGKSIGTYCTDCGTARGQLHELGCRFEQCAGCDRLLASCLCGIEKEAPFGWVEAEGGFVPSDEVRIPFGKEDYPLDLIGIFDGYYGLGPIS